MWIEFLIQWKVAASTKKHTHRENHLFHLYCLHAEQTNTDEGGKCIRAAEKIELENTILSAFPKVTNVVEWYSNPSQGSASSAPGLM